MINISLHLHSPANPGLPPDGIFDAPTASDTGPADQQRNPAEGNPCHGPATGRDAPHAAHRENAARLVRILGPAEHLPSVPIDAKATARYPQRPQQAQRTAAAAPAPAVGPSAKWAEPPEQHRRWAADARCPESLACANDGWWPTAGPGAGQWCRWWQ